MMKDLAVLRGVVMMALLLVSMYLVFSTVSDKMSPGEEADGQDDLEKLNTLLENFEVMPPPPPVPPIEPLPASVPDAVPEAEDLAESLQDKHRDQQDRADRERAQAALAESIRQGEANRLLEKVAEPLLEKQDVQVGGALPDGRQLAESLDALVDSLQGETPEAEQPGTGTAEPDTENP